MNILLILTCLISFSIASSIEKIEWTKFKQTFGRTYKSPLEEQERFENFKRNLKEVNDHNKRYKNGEVTYFLRVNHFSDWTKEEFRNFNRAKPPTNVTYTPVPKSDVVPDFFNWHNAFFYVPRDQRECSASYAISALGVVEALNYWYNGKRSVLSPQNVVDCSYHKDGNKGCNGGYDYEAINYIVQNGINQENDYPYVANFNFCKFYATKRADVSVSGYYFLDKTEEALKVQVGTKGPVSVMINIDDFMQYGGGIYNNPECSSDVNHFVIATGYGTEKGVDYWAIRNSFGPYWGESGYFKIVRNAGNQCGFGLYNMYPVVN